jgi:hypothetical protein
MRPGKQRQATNIVSNPMVSPIVSEHELYVQVEINLSPRPVLPIMGFIDDRAKDMLITAVTKD